MRKRKKDTYIEREAVLDARRVMHSIALFGNQIVNFSKIHFIEFISFGLGFHSSRDGGTIPLCSNLFLFAMSHHYL